MTFRWGLFRRHLLTTRHMGGKASQVKCLVREAKTVATTPSSYTYRCCFCESSFDKSKKCETHLVEVHWSDHYEEVKNAKLLVERCCFDGEGNPVVFNATGTSPYKMAMTPLLLLAPVSGEEEGRQSFSPRQMTYEEHVQAEEEEDDSSSSDDTDIDADSPAAAASNDEDEEVGDHALAKIADFFIPPFRGGEAADLPAAAGDCWKGCVLANAASAKSFPEATLFGQMLDREAGAEGARAPTMPVFLNTHEPFCMVAVGVQGGGKSHTLASVLEGCLIPHPEGDISRLTE